MNIFKKSLALTLATVALVGLTACSSANTDKYLIATDTTFAPFEFEDKDGNYVGIDVEILAAIAEDQDFEYELQTLGFNAAVQALESKQVDGVIAGMSINEERMLKFDFSVPYFDSGVIMATAANNNDVTSYEDLRGKKVAIKTGTEGSVFAEKIKEEYGFETVYYDDSANLYEDVKMGNSVACFDDYPVLGYAIKQNIGLKFITEKEQGSSYGFAVSKGKNKELLDKFNAGYASIVASGKYQEILDKYIQE